MQAIAAMILFQSIVLVLAGWGIGDFLRYEWLLPALLVQNLAKIVGRSV